MNFNWRIFLEDCLQQKYVLVVGDEIMLDENVCGGDCHKYIIQKYAEAVTEDEELDRREFFVDYKIPVEYFNKHLYELLKLKLFRVVVTTTVDDLIERVMRDIWGDKLRVVDFYDEDNDLKIIGNRNEFFETEPTLYYAFGRANLAGTFAYNEDDKLKIVSDWLNHSGNGFPRQFYNYIQTKKLLALGCKQEDWLFRFLWYSFRRNVRILDNSNDVYSKMTEKRHMGTIAIEFDSDSESDASLIKFIKRNGNLFERNAIEFTQEFVAKMGAEDEDGEIAQMIKNNTLGGCFISYASEDFNFAFNLYLTLKNKGFEVWIDNNKLKPGADYTKRISAAIEQCSIFMPILSATTQRDYECGEFDKQADKRYYLKEWDLAVGMNKHIIPVLTEEFSIKSEAYAHTPWKVGDVDKTAFVKEHDSLHKLIAGLKDIIAHGNTK